MNKKLIVDPELEEYLGHASKFAEEQLETDILAEGCKEPIVVWKGKDIIIDGHRRHAICTKHNIDYQIEEVELPDKDAVRDWMDCRQGRRRNWDKQTEHKHIARLVAAAPSEGGKINNVAAATGKSPSTVKRAKRYGEALAKLDTNVRKTIETKNLRATNEVLKKLASKPAQEQKRLVESVVSGKVDSLSEAVKSATSPEVGVNVTPDNKVTKERTPERQRKIDRFDTATKHLGRTMADLDEINQEHPSEHHMAAIRLIEKVDEEIQAWKSAVQEVEEVPF